MSRHNWTDDKLFLRLLNNKSDNTYWANIIALRSKGTVAVFNKSLDLIKAPNIKEKIVGIDLLAQLGLPPRPFYKETIDIYFALLATETNPKVLYSILYGIGHNNQDLDLSQTAQIVLFKKHENKSVRKAVVSALLGVDNKTAIDTMIFLTNDKDVSTRNWATFGIGTMIERNTKSIRSALWKRVTDKNEDTKLEAIMGLAKRKDIQIKEIIKQELLKGESGTLLFKAIEALNDKNFLPLLEQNLKEHNSDKTIDPEWLVDLKACIGNLKSLE